TRSTFACRRRSRRSEVEKNSARAEGNSAHVVGSAVGPPSTPFGHPRHLTAVAAGWPFRVERDEGPTGTHEKRLHVALEAYEAFHVREGERAGDAVLDDDQVYARGRLFAAQQELIVAAPERPGAVLHPGGVSARTASFCR